MNSPAYSNLRNHNVFSMASADEIRRMSHSVIKKMNKGEVEKALYTMIDEMNKSPKNDFQELKEMLGVQIEETKKLIDNLNFRLKHISIVQRETASLLEPSKNSMNHFDAQTQG